MNLTKAGKLNFKFRSHGVIASHSTGLMAWQSDLFFNGLKFVFLFLLILTATSFFGLKKAKAAEEPPPIVIPPKVVINEVYYKGLKEWIELYNAGDAIVDISGWQICDHLPTEHCGTLNSALETDFLPGSFIIISHSEGDLNGWSVNPSVKKIYYEGNKIAFNDTGGDTVILKDDSINVIDQITYLGNECETGESLERRPSGFDTGGASDFIIQLNPTPGSGIPQSVILQNPKINNTSIILEWSKADSTSFAGYEIYLSEKSGEIGYIIDYLDEDEVENDFYRIDNLDAGLSYFFTIRNYNLAGNYSDSSQVSIFLPIIYSKAIIINEILPRPENGADNEFIELYNSGNIEVDLSGWFLDDAEGGSTPFKIPDKLLDFPDWTPNIQSGEYKIFYRYQTGIALNDSGGDSARLLYPNGKIAYSISYNESALLGFSFARGPTDICLWTTTPTPRAKNIITAPVIVTDQTDEPVINAIPIEISTGDFENYLDKLVKIRGKVISTSGNTFYLDDGSGVIKVYIQEKTGIEKPEMHRNDIFEIIGVVDLYGQTWRILPRILNDITLIEKAPVVTKKTTIKKVASKAVTTVKSPLISKAVAAASTSPPNENKDKNNTLSQLIKTSIGLAILFLIFLIIKILNQPKLKSIGGHFGDDET